MNYTKQKSILQKYLHVGLAVHCSQIKTSCQIKQIGKREAEG